MASWWVLLLLLAFNAGQLVRLNIFFPEVHLNLLDIFTTLFIIVNITIYPKRFFHTLKEFPLFRPILIFIGICIVSLFRAFPTYGQNAGLVGLFYLIRWSAYTLTVVPFIWHARRIDYQKLLVILGFSQAVWGIVQYLFYPDIRHLALIDWDPHFYRVVGNLLDPGFVGVLLLFTLIILSLHERTINIPKWILIYLPLVFTYSRSTYLAYAFAMTAISLAKKSWRFGLITLTLLLISLPLLPRASDGEGVKLERTSSIAARLKNWQDSLYIFSSNPIIGVGFNTYRYAQKEYGFISGQKWKTSHAGAGADSSLLFVAATTGIFGFSTYLWYLWTLYQLNSRTYFLKISLVAILIHSFFLNSLFYPFVLIWLSLLTAYTVTGEHK